VSETDLAAVAATLARVLGRRPDVTTVYGAPPDTDLDGVLRWAAQAAVTPDEPARDQLSPYRSALEALAAPRTLAAVPGAHWYVAARSRLGALRRKLRG
jgi:hypothetical protein